MKKIILFYIFCIFFVGNPVFAQIFLFNGSGNGAVPDYCLIGGPTTGFNDSRATTCYWCETGGDRGGYCTKEYAGCFGGKDMIVSEGQVFQDEVTGENWACTSDGWQNSLTPPTCYLGSGCKDGCYWDAAPYTCLSCPPVDFTSLESSTLKAYTEKPGERSDISDCFVKAGERFFDLTGEFELRGNCHYSE